MLSYLLFFIAMFCLSKLILSYRDDQKIKNRLIKAAKKFKNTNDYSHIKQLMYDQPLAMLWCLRKECAPQQLTAIDVDQLATKEFKPNKEYVDFSLHFISNLSFNKMQEPETLGKLLNSFLDNKKAP